MNIAIVGQEEHSWNHNQIPLVKSKIQSILSTSKDMTLISGHCPKGGVDIWAEEIASTHGIKKVIFKPEVNQWLDKEIIIDAPLSLSCKNVVTQIGYKTRNIKIAEACDILYCIVSASRHPDCVSNAFPANLYCKHCQVWGHPTNGGCFTLKEAKKLNKETHLIIVENVGKP